VTADVAAAASSAAGEHLSQLLEHALQQEDEQQDITTLSAAAFCARYLSVHTRSADKSDHSLPTTGTTCGAAVGHVPHLVWCVQVNEVILLANQPPCCIFERDATQAELLLQHQRLAPVGADNDLLVLRNGSQQRNAQHFLQMAAVDVFVTLVAAVCANSYIATQPAV
jgi:hypothetical protein